jgi:RNA polymerase sigma factor (sigma-70 family)
MTGTENAKTNQWMQSDLRGDTAGLDSLLKEHGQYLAATCSGLCRDYRQWEGTGEDLFQSTICKVTLLQQSKWPPLDCAIAWKRWLRAIARHLLLDELRANNRRTRLEREYGRMAAMERVEEPPGEEVVEETHEAIRDALERHCDDRMRGVVQMRLNKRTWKEIAESMRINVTAARRAWDAAKQILSQALVNEDS